MRLFVQSNGQDGRVAGWLGEKAHGLTRCASCRVAFYNAPDLFVGNPVFDGNLPVGKFLFEAVKPDQRFYNGDVRVM